MSGSPELQFHNKKENHFNSLSQDRRAGDLLLAIFDQKSVPNRPDNDLSTRPLNYLGRITGKIKLPTPITKPNTHIRIYLAPENRAGKDWSGDGLHKIDEQLLPIDGEITFAFDTVTPGKFRLKAIWDKRPPFTDATSTGPGDYESDWSPPTPSPPAKPSPPSPSPAPTAPPAASPITPPIK